MAGNSKFVLRWEIDNPAVRLPTRNGDSEVFNEGGFEWVAGFRPNIQSDRAHFILNCNNPRGEKWRCEADVQLVYIKTDGPSPHNTNRVKFSDGERVHEMIAVSSIFYPAGLADPSIGYVTNGNVVVEFHVTIINSECIEPKLTFDLPQLSSPIETNNVTLVIEEKKVKVSKDYLSIHSPVFHAMFCTNFAEKRKEEVEIKDVLYEEFLDLLHLIYPGAVEITNRTVLHIMKLADQFQMKGVMDQSEKFLFRSTEFKNKLSIADQYRLVRLKDHCLQSITTSQKLIELCKSPEFANFSVEMKAAICERFSEI